MGTQEQEARGRHKKRDTGEHLANEARRAREQVGYQARRE